jgi:hypothetical protein
MDKYSCRKLMNFVKGNVNVNALIFQLYKTDWTLLRHIVDTVKALIGSLLAGDKYTD